MHTRREKNGFYFIIWLITALCAAAAFVVMTTKVDPAGRAGAGMIRGADQAYYFSYVRSVVIDRDLDFKNEYEYFGIEISPAPKTGLPINKYSIGLPLLALPFYASVHAIVGADGFSMPYQMAFSLSGILYGFLGLILSYGICRRFFSEKNSFVATTAVFLATNLFYYFVREPFMAHLASFFAVSLFLHSWLKIRLDDKTGPGAWFLLGLGAAFMVMARQQDAAFLAIPLLDVAFGFLSRKSPARPGLAGVAALLAGFAPAIFLQMLVWKIIFGSYVVYSYGAEPFAYAGSPRVLDVLFSSRHGLISWTPVIFFSLAGLFAALFAQGSNVRRFAVLFIIAFLLELYINASWHMWWLGYAFGARGFIGCTAIFAFGLASLMEKAEERFKSPLKFFVPLFAALALWNAVMMTAYMAEMIPYGDYFNWTDFLASLGDLPEAVLRKAGM